jgi:geranylgeranyl reductase family protein
LNNLLKTNVCIIGAGPGGAVTALFLAKAGIPSILIDKANFPRDKVCGDALSGKVVSVLNKLDPNILERLNASPIQLNSWGINFIAPNLKELKIPFKMNYNINNPPIGFISKRIDFDNFLIEEVRKQPLINLIEGKEINEFYFYDNEWTLTTSDASTTIQSKLVIAADGAKSLFAKRIGNIKFESKHYCAGIRAYYKGVKGMDKDNFIELIFLKDFLPGYLWIFPLPNGQANVGIAMRSDIISKRKINLKTCMMDTINNHAILKERFKDAVLVDEIKGFGLPLGSKKRKISGNNFLLVGDAASLIDPFSGEGIGNAMKSGMIAAQITKKCIVSNNFNIEMLQQYDAEVYKKLWSELKLSHKMQQLVYYPKLFNLIVNKANKNKVLRETIICMFDDIDIREKLKRPSFYIKLLFSD